jgi:hypothetical protein
MTYEIPTSKELATLASINERFVRGNNGLTDIELNDLIAYYDILNELIEFQGREFMFAQREIRSRRETLNSLKDARKTT